MAQEKKGRRSIRLTGFDYSQAASYFITICTHKRKSRFGVVDQGEVIVSPLGRIVEQEWLRTALIRPEVRLDEYVIMPNHMHAIVEIMSSSSARDRVGAHGLAPLQHPARSLGSLVARFKGAVTRRARQLHGSPTLVLWQRNYYERVIRNARELNALRRYIRFNPLHWERDRYHVQG